MKYTENEVLTYAAENDVKFIKLTFCDLFGRSKNISITREKLADTFKHGLSFDATSIDGFYGAEDANLILFPDPSTLCVLPWRPEHGRVVRMFCNIMNADGTPYVNDSRRILRKAIEDTSDLGVKYIFGPECEFYLFKTSDDGYPLKVAHDRAGFLDTSPKDRGENLRRDICFTLEQMSLAPHCSHHEKGPGQHEIGFTPSETLTAADNIMTYFMTIKAIAARNGLHASFMPKPMPDEIGNGFHINISIYEKLNNAFYSKDGNISKIAESFCAGILDKVCDMTAFFNSTQNSYARLADDGLPDSISWSYSNRSELIRILRARADEARMEIRSPDAMCNPYLSFALLIYAGADGIRKGLTLPKELEFDCVSKAQSKKMLPSNLREALSVARSSEFLKSCLPRETLDGFISAKLAECDAYDESSDKVSFEERKYF